jgi:hypothetical protein
LHSAGTNCQVEISELRTQFQPCLPIALDPSPWQVPVTRQLMLAAIAASPTGTLDIGMRCRELKEEAQHVKLN